MMLLQYAAVVGLWHCRNYYRYLARSMFREIIYNIMPVAFRRAGWAMLGQGVSLRTAIVRLAKRSIQVGKRTASEAPQSGW